MYKRPDLVIVVTLTLGLTALAVAHNGSTRMAASQTPNADLISKLTAAKKAGVGQPLVVNGKQVCGPNGDSKKPNMEELDNKKNRTDEPNTSDYIAISWDDMKGLPADKVSDIEGAPVMVVGYLSHKVNVEKEPPGESTNCHLNQPNEVDWHIYLTKTPNQPIADAVIVETTPRVRPKHNWTSKNLAAYVNKNTQVRMSGWLFYDLEHLDVVGKERATVWEVHPVTRIEVQDANGNWVVFDK